MNTCLVIKIVEKRKTRWSKISHEIEVPNNSHRTVSTPPMYIKLTSVRKSTPENCYHQILVLISWCSQNPHYNIMSSCKSKIWYASSNTNSRNTHAVAFPCIRQTQRTRHLLTHQNAFLITYAFLVHDHGNHRHDLCLPWHLQQPLLVHSQTTYVQ